MIASAQKKRGRLAASATALLLIAGFSWWALHIPHDALAPFGAIPDGVAFAHVSDDPGKRWAAIRENPLLPVFISSNDLRAINMVAAFAGAESDATQSKIGRGVIAYCPPSPRLPEGAWFAAAWLGSHSHLLRWWLTLACPESIQPLYEYGARPTWITSKPVNKQGQHLTLAVADGLLLLCLSHDQSAIRFSLAAHDKLFPSLRSAAWLPATLADSPMPETTEQGWLRLPGEPAQRGMEPSLRYAFAEMQSNRLDLRAQLNMPLPFDAPCRALNANDLQAAACAEPALLAMLPVETLDILASMLPPSHWTYALLVLLQSGLIQTSNAPLILAATTKSSAGLGKPPLRMPLPAAVIAAPAGQNVENMRESLFSISKIIDARLDIGLAINETTQANTLNFHQLQASSIKSSLLKPEPNDLPAFARQNDLIFFSTSGGHLSNCLNQTTAQSPDPGRPTSNLAAPETPESLWVWADLEQTGKALEEALALWRLKSIWEGAKNRDIAETEQIMNIAHALRAMGCLSLRARVNSSNSSQWQITIAP